MSPDHAAKAWSTDTEDRGHTLFKTTPRAASDLPLNGARTAFLNVRNCICDDRILLFRTRSRGQERPCIISACSSESELCRVGWCWKCRLCNVTKVASDASVSCTSNIR